MRGLFLFQRDLRFEDQMGLYRAMEQSDELFLTAIFDESCHRLTTKEPLGFNLTERICALIALEQNASAMKLPLVIGMGDTVEWVTTLCRCMQIESVWLNVVIEPDFLTMYQTLKLALGNMNVTLNLCEDTAVIPFSKLMNKSQQPYKVFTPFYKTWHSFLEPELLSSYQMPWSKHIIFLELGSEFRENEVVVQQYCDKYMAIKTSIVRDKLEKLSTSAYYLKEWENFKNKKMRFYSTSRDFPYLSGTSELSSAINNGQISYRKLVLESMLHSDGEAFLRQLAWRSFYQSILYHFPEVIHTAFIAKYRQLEWGNDEALFEKWKLGKTGFPLIDAAMVQLRTEGRMPNRLRMLVASFLTKQMNINWQWGEAYFYEMLCDGDLAANNG
jgi:deoxyribodipyrimidine photo-lyase